MKKNNPIQVNEISTEAKASLRTRLLTAIVGFAIIIPCIFLGDWALLALLLFCVAVGTIEIIRCAKKKYSRWAYVCMFFLCAAIMLWPMARVLITESINGKLADFGGHAYNGFNTLDVSLLFTIVAIFALFYVIMWDENFTVRDACFLFTVGFLMSLGFQSLIFLRSIPSIGCTTPGFYNVDNTFGSVALLIYVLIGTFMTDTGAYFTGMLFGKKKINPRISPKKTWAGFFGGLVVSTAFSFAFGMIFACCNKPMLPIFSLDKWYNILILSMLMPPFATLGDFVFSAIKRYYDVKDFGKLLPGHGGILDRCDSIIFSSLVAAIYVAIGMWANSGFKTDLFL